MAKFIKSKFKVLWGTVFSFFYGFFATEIVAQENDDSTDAVEESEKDIALDPGAIAAAVAAAPSTAGGEAPAEEKDDFTIMLTAAGDKKINVIKEVRAVTELGLKEAKDLVEGAPKEVKSGVNKKEAEEIKAKLEAAGAKVELK